MENITYRILNLTDHNTIFSFFKFVMTNPDLNKFTSPFVNGEIEDYLYEEYGTAVGAFDGDNLISFGAINNLDSYLPTSIEKIELDIVENKVCMLVRFFTLPNYQGKGVISKIQDMLIEIANKQEFDYVIANVHPENIPSIKILSKRLSFVKTINYKGITRNIMKLYLKQGE